MIDFSRDHPVTKDMGRLTQHVACATGTIYTMTMTGPADHSNDPPDDGRHEPSDEQPDQQPDDQSDDQSNHGASGPAEPKGLPPGASDASDASDAGGTAESTSPEPVRPDPWGDPSDDLTKLLREWAMMPGQVNARRVRTADGRVVVQVRIDLGVLQMEVDGRPDGQSFDGGPTALQGFQSKLEAYERTSGSSTGFVLTAQDCRMMRQEAMQIYHRYVALFALGDYERVIRDTLHNLRIAEMCHDFGESANDQNVLQQFRPQLILMRRRAEAELALTAGQPDGALQAIDTGLEELSRFFEAHSEQFPPDIMERSSEVQMLRGMRDALVPKLPMSQRAELEERLQSALDDENYELAAILRDELRMM